MPNTKTLHKLSGRVIKKATVYLGGAYMDTDDRSLQLDFEDGTHFVFEVTLPRALEGVAAFFDHSKDEPRDRKVLTPL